MPVRVFLSQRNSPADHDRDPKDEESSESILDVGELNRDAPVEHSSHAMSCVKAPKCAII